MAENRYVPPTDPHHVPVLFANELGAIGLVNGVVNMTLVTWRLTPGDNKTELDPVVCARLRFDLQTAVVLRDALNAQIALAAKPEGEAH